MGKPSDSAGTTVAGFVAKWDGTERAERANYISFLNDLCAVLGVPAPEPASGSGGDYRFERSVRHLHADGSETPGRIDLYKRGCFVLEAKQAANPRTPDLFGIRGDAEHRAAVRRSPAWAQAMLKAKGQAERYARDLPAEEGWPPFLIVCDVGFCFDLYADFSGTGKHYAQFPDREGFRIYLSDLVRPESRELLRAIWTDPRGLDPARRRVRVTREIAMLLAKLARALEAQGRPPETVATFLMRCIFSMFAQSVGLLPTNTAFTDLLLECRENLQGFVPLVGDMWRQMNTGGFSPALRSMVRRFNGGLFAAGGPDPVEPLPVDADMLDLLIMAARRDWADVEPAIFGTLLENALDARQRGELGAHFTPRAFVERLVLPTVMEPLRTEWDGVKADAVQRADAGDKAAAAATVRGFHARLCAVRVLDPACGTGNFLYVTMELMKRLEGEVLDLLADLQPGEGDRLDVSGASVDPHQFLGLEKNGRAVPVAELVLWIGWLQWHFRTRGKVPPAEPILRDFHNIRHQDALLESSGEEPDRDARGDLVSRWGGRTMRHPITGEMVPDENDRVLVMRPVGAKAAEWPEADFIVGNPPFIAGKDLRAELGAGNAEALWRAYPKIPKSADLAMYFWWKAAQALTVNSAARRFGFLTSNSIRQVFCRRIVASAMEGKRPLHLVFAVPDHPWADGKGTAAVRIAMTAAAAGAGSGVLATVARETSGADGVPEVQMCETEGVINADLTIGTDIKAAKPLRANEGLASPGVKLHGSGFIVSPATARNLGLGKIGGLERHIRPYLNGRDILRQSRNSFVIDLFGLPEPLIRKRFPSVWEHLDARVRTVRAAIAGTTPDAAQYARDWWLHGKPRPEMRLALENLKRYIVTVETAKHRVFVLLDAEILPDNMLIAIALSDAFYLGVLQSRVHVSWSLAAGGTLEDRPRYNKTVCFDPFPFPTPMPDQHAAVAVVAEELDALRKERLAAHPYLTLTALYNVLAALRAGRALTPAEKDVHDAGHVSILRTLHDRLDAAVAAAYGWPANLTDTEIVARLVALNAARVAEEATGLVRWLRPEFQAPAQALAARKAVQTELAVDAVAPTEKPAWPKEAPAQFVALRRMLADGPASAPDVARRFRNPPRSGKVAEMLKTLAALGQAKPAGGTKFAA